MNKVLNTLKEISEQAKANARQSNDFEAYSQASNATQFIDALIALEQLAFKSRYSQVDFKLYCGSSFTDGVRVDYEVEGADEWGNKTGIASDLNLDSLVEAIIEIADSTVDERPA